MQQQQNMLKINGINSWPNVYVVIVLCSHIKKSNLRYTRLIPFRVSRVGGA